MAELTEQEKIEVSTTVQKLPDMVLLTARSETWSVPMFDYAISNIHMCKEYGQQAALDQLKGARVERMQELAEQRAIERDAEGHNLADRRHKEALEESSKGTVIGKKTLFWTRMHWE